MSSETKAQFSFPRAAVMNRRGAKGKLLSARTAPRLQPGLATAALLGAFRRFPKAGIFSLLLAIPASAPGGPREVASNSFPSVAMIVTEDSHGQPLVIGSGFFVKEKILTSNAHVVEMAAGGYVKVVGEEKKREIKGIVAIDPKHDLVLLEVEGTRTPYLDLGDFSKSAIGDTVYSVGSPKGLEGTFAQGIISSVREVGGEKVLQHTAPISPGSSGGPILNADGKVIGVAVATFKDGQNLNFAIPVTYLSSLITKLSEPKALRDLKQTSEPGSYLNEIGAPGRAAITITSFIWTETALEFVIRNNLRTPVTNIKAIIIFREENGEPCDCKEAGLPPSDDDLIKIPSTEEFRKGAKIQVIPAPLRPGMAKPSKVKVDAATRLRAMKTPPEARVLGFDIVKSGD